MKAELQRRASLESTLSTFLQGRPNEWIPMKEMHQGGDAWRSRLPYVRRRFREEQIGVVLWNKQYGGASAYMFIPHIPLGRDPSTPTQQPELF